MPTAASTSWNSLCLLGLPMGTEATWGAAHTAYNSWQYLCLVKLPMPPGVAYGYWGWLYLLSPSIAADHATSLFLYSIAYKTKRVAPVHYTPSTDTVLRCLLSVSLVSWQTDW